MKNEIKNNCILIKTVPNPVKACYVVSKENYERLSALSKSSRKLFSASALVDIAITRLLEDIDNNEISFVLNLSELGNLSETED